MMPYILFEYVVNENPYGNSRACPGAGFHVLVSPASSIGRATTQHRLEVGKEHCGGNQRS